MTTGWILRPFEDCIEQVRYTGKIQRKNFLKQGAYPVISQEEEFINGYWDNETEVFKATNPLIIFGDHTKVLKYVDFDFVLGADGVKLLQPQSFLVPKFLFYQLQMANLASLGYARHYKLLKELKVVCPPKIEQKRIVRILDESFEDVATVKDNTERNLQNARAIFANYLESVFSNSDKGWAKKTLSDLCEIKHGFAFDGALFSRDVPEGNPLVATPGNFTEDGRLLFNEKNAKRLSGKPPDGFRFDIGDLVVVMTDLSSKMKILGKPAMVEMNDLLHNQRIGRVVFTNDHIEKRFVYYFMLSERFLRNIKVSATGTMVKHTAPKRILSNTISFPLDRKEQRAIVNKFDTLRNEIQRLGSLYQQKITALEMLKKSLLHQAFSGKL